MKKIFLFTCLFAVLSCSCMAKTVNIPINPAREYDFKNREEIFSVRQKTIEKYPEIFGGEYQVRGPVFEQVEDGKPWWGLQGMACLGTGEKSITGLSEESRFIDNPFLLIAVDQGHAFQNPEKRCTDTYPKPTSVSFDLDKMTVYIRYNVSNFQRYIKNMHNREAQLALRGLNARSIIGHLNSAF